MNLFDKVNFDKICTRIIFILIICLAVFMHCYKIASVPFGIHVDEAGMGYDAWCLANYGVDRYLNSFPVYFINFGGGQSVLYAYICAIFVKLFGLSVITLRIPGIIFALLTMLFGSLIIREKYGKDKKPLLLFMILYTILPYFTMQSRFGLECNLMLGTTTIMLYCFIKAIKKQNNIWFIIFGFSTGIALYSYALSYIVIPIFLFFSFIYLIYIKRFSFKNFICFSIPLAILATPIILMVIINKFGLSQLEIGPLTIPKLLHFRGGEIPAESFIKALKTTIYSTLLYDWLPYNTFSKYLTMFWISIPFIVIAIVHGLYTSIISIIRKKFEITYIIWAWGLSVFILGCLLGGDYANANKLNGIFFSQLFFLVDGINIVFKYLNTILIKKVIGTDFYKLRQFAKNFFITIIILCYLLNFLSFFNYYFFKYPLEIYPQIFFANTFNNALEQLDKQKVIKDRDTYIGENVEGYIYYLISSNTSPYDFNIRKNDLKRYKNFIFSLPKEIDVNANYIIAETNKSYINKLDQYSFDSKIKIDCYYVYYNSIS